MYVVLCVYVVWYVFYSITLHYYTVFSVHTLFKYLQIKIHIFAPFAFSSIVTNLTTCIKNDIVVLYL